MVPGGGVEPPRPCGRRILSPLRLPVPPSRPGVGCLGKYRTGFASGASGGTCAFGTANTIGQTCTLNVTFTPRDPGHPPWRSVLLQDGSGNVLATNCLQGVDLGPQINYPPGTQITVVNSAGLTPAERVAADGAGNVYAADGGSGQPRQVPVLRCRNAGHLSPFGGTTRAELRSGCLRAPRS